MDYFIAFLKCFTDIRVKKCPFCTQQGLKTTFEWPKVVSEESFPRFWGGLFSGIFRFGDRKCRFRDIAICVFFTKNCANRNISETALPITETKKRKHFAIESTPQNLGKLTSETTFGHSKVVFRPLLRTKRTFSQNPPMSRF